MMMGNMMQMMQQMMSGMMQNQDAMHRMRMMGMDGMGMMQGRMSGGAIEHVEGHIAFLKAELKITAAQEKAWGDYAEALRANAKQLGVLAAESAKAPAAATPARDRAADEAGIDRALCGARRRSEKDLRHARDAAHGHAALNAAA
jgi:hypothetical protein